MIGHGQSAGTKTWFVCLKVSFSYLWHQHAMYWYILSMRGIKGRMADWIWPVSWYKDMHGLRT